MKMWQVVRRRQRPAKAVRRHARRVAFVATVVAGIVYVSAAAVGDLVVLAHLQSGVDERLSEQLSLLTRTIPRGGVPSSIDQSLQRSTALSLTNNGDIDDTPIFDWWLPKGSATTIGLNSNAPTLARPSTSNGVFNQDVANSAFRFHQVSLARGTAIVGTSVVQLSDTRTTLLALEASLLPIVLLLIFFVATVIGRGAASPIERARQEQLDFTADASHELRTPLAVIEAEVGLALTNKRSAESYRQALERISDESKRLRGIVDDLLWLARLDALPDPPVLELVDLGALVEGAAARFRPIAAVRSITLTCTTEQPEGPLVKAPADWLDRLVSVLLDNACRYADSGGTIDIMVKGKGDASVLIVDDSGPGISDDQLREVKRRFHRASDTPGGAGLGLSIAETVIEGTGATWQLGRAPSGGTRIEVSWPAPRGDAQYLERPDIPQWSARSRLAEQAPADGPAQKRGDK